MYKIIMPVFLIIYLVLKYRMIAQTEPGPVEGKVLFPRQDAKFAHGAMSILEAVFVLEFISHDFRDRDAWIRLLFILAVFVLTDLIFWLKLRNTGIEYSSAGISVRNFLGAEKKIPWSDIKEVRTAGTGVKSTKVFRLKTTQGTIVINARSGGVQRFRNYMEEHI